MDEEIKAILDEAYEQVTVTLREQCQALDRLAEALLPEKESPGERVLDLAGVEDEGPV